MLGYDQDRRVGSLVGNLFFGPAVEAALDGEAEAAAAHATVAGLVLVAAALTLTAVAAVHAIGAVATVLKARAKGGQANRTAVRAAAVARSQKATNRRRRGNTGVGGVTVRDASRLAVRTKLGGLGHLKTKLVGRRLGSTEHGVLLGSHLQVLLVLLLVRLLGELAQVHGERVVGRVEQSGRLLVAVVGRGAAVLRTASLGRTDTITAGRRSLLHLPGRVATAVLAKVDLELLVVVSAANGLNGLDRVGNVGKVDKGAALLSQSVYQFNLAILRKVLAQSLLGPGLVQVANVNVARGTAANSQRDSRRESTRVLSPANLQSAVVNHETLEVAQGVERSGGGRVDEGDETYVLVGNITDMVKQATADDVANLFNRSLGVDVAQVDCAVAEIVNTTGGSSDSGRSHRLLGEGVGNNIAVGTREHVSVAGSNAEILCGILLLCLGNVSASVLAVVNTARSLPLGLLGKLCDGLDGVGNGEIVDESNAFFSDNLDSVNRTKLAQVVANLLLGDLLRQVTKVDVAGSARLLDSERDRSGNLRGLAPANLDILTLDAELFQNGVRVEVGGGAGVKERDKGAVLVGKKTHRLDLAAADVSENLFGRCVRRNVAQVYCSARSANSGRVHGNRRARLHGGLHVKATSRRLGRKELRSTVLRGRNHGVVLLRRHVLLGRAGNAAVVLLVALLLLLALEGRQGLELGAAKGSWATRLEGTAHEELRWQKRGELHVKGGAGGGDIGSARALVHVLCVEGGNVAASRVSLGKARYVGGKGAMREAGIAVGGFRGMAVEATRAGAVLSGTVQVLHTEKVRGDEGVPPGVR